MVIDLTSWNNPGLTINVALTHPSDMNAVSLVIAYRVMCLYLVFPACLCATDFPTLWILREPLIPARPWPSQQDLEHLATPHDCHHLCVAFTAGRFDGCSLWWASGNQRNMRIIFFQDTMGMCRKYPLTFCFFFPPFFLFCHSGIFVLLKRTQGWTKPESVLFDHFSAVFLFIGVLF